MCWKKKFEMSEAEKHEAKLHFFQKTDFPGIIGCIDRTHIKILAPSKEDQHLYLNRKGFFSLNVMLVSTHVVFKEIVNIYSTFK